MTTSNKQLNIPVTGSTPGGPGGWGDQIDVNFNNIDSCLGSTLALSVSSSDITLTKGTVSTPGQISNLRISISGTLLTNISIIFPAGAAGAWLISNSVDQGTGPFSITLKTSGVGSTISLQNRFGFFTVYSDGTNMYFVDSSTPPGMIQTFGGASAPAGWLVCDGSSVSINNYPFLFSAIKYAWGGSGPNFNLPDLRGMFVRGTGTNSLYPSAVGGAVGVTGYQPDIYLNHSHSVTDPGHFHSLANQLSSGGASIPGGSGYQFVAANTSLNITNISVNSSNTGGSETRPKNFAVLYCIKT